MPYNEGCQHRSGPPVARTCRTCESSSPAASYPMNAERKQNGDGGDHDPPHRDVRRSTQAIGDGERGCDAHRDSPVVADDEVVPKSTERADLRDHESPPRRATAGSPTAAVDVVVL